MNLFPQVKTITFNQGFFELSEHLTYQKTFTTQANIKELQTFLSVQKNLEYEQIIFLKNLKLNDEAYRLEITQDKIIIESKTMIGQLWAIKTLKQIVKQSKHNLPCLQIEDEPELKIRGYMLDISRGKIPKMKTLYRIIDMLSDLKMNHFELYVEGFSYRYPSFKSVYFEQINALKPEDFQKLDRYSKSKGIDFVPCHNTFGHMTEWLKQDEFSELAMIKEGMEMWGGHRPASTLNPLLNETHDFIKKLLDDAVLGSNSKYFNFCFDEAYELGHGKSKQACEQHGIEHIFIDYMLKIYTHLIKKGKKPMMWGDFFNDHPKALEMLPQDLIVIDWGYDHNYPFDQRLKRLSENKIPFISAPGTSSWNSLSGRTYDMLVNIEKAIEYTKKYNGLGTLLTDWGDHGHIQHLIISYPAIIYTALESWSNHTGNLELTKTFLNDFIYEDENKILGNLSFDIGTYYRHQKKYSYNGTHLFRLLLKINTLKNYTLDDFKEAVKDIAYSSESLRRIQSEYKLYLKALKQVQSKKNIKHEILAFKNTIQFVILLCEVLLIGKEKQQKEHRILTKELDLLMKNQQKLWLYANQPSGLNMSMNFLEKIQKFINAQTQKS
jgi:hexosaminidase